MSARRERIEQETMARYYADGAEVTLKRLFERVAALENALFCYTDATGAQSFEYEELRDIGEAARETLGYGDHDATCKWPNESETCTCGLGNRIRADFGMEPQ
jgi:hypothetical protein